MIEDFSAQDTPPIERIEDDGLPTVFLRQVGHRPARNGEVIDIEKFINDHKQSMKTMVRTAYVDPDALMEEQTKHKIPLFPRVPVALRHGSLYQEMRLMRIDLPALEKRLNEIGEAARAKQLPSQQTVVVKVPSDCWTLSIPKPIFAVKLLRKLFSRRK